MPTAHRRVLLRLLPDRQSATLAAIGRGVGPAYQDKVARVGVRVQDLLDAAAGALGLD